MSYVKALSSYDAQKPAFNDGYELASGIRDSVVICLPLNEGGSNRAHDVSSYDNKGLVVGAEWVRSKRGTVLRFDSALAQGVEIPSSPTHEIDQHITLSAWVYPESNSSSGRKVICKYNGASSSSSLYVLQLYPSAVGFRLRISGSIYNCNSSFGAPLNEWTHVLGSYDGENMRLYVNGSLVSTFVVSGLIESASYPLMIGNSGKSGGGVGTNSSRNFDGLIDLPLVMNRAVTAREARELFANPYGIFRPRPRLTITQDSGGTTSPVSLAGVTASLNTAAGSYVSNVPVAGSTASISTVGGVMSANINISGDIISEAITTAALAAGMEMTGAIIQDAINTGNLTIGMSMDGNTIAEAASSGTFTADESGNLFGSLSSASSTDAAVITTVPMTGATLASSSTSGSMARIQPLAGGTVSVTNVNGSLNISVALSADTSAESLADGTLTFRVRMDGKTITEAASAGMFGLGGEHRLPPRERLEIVGFEQRIETIPFENRIAAA